MKDENDFLQKLKNRDPELVIKIVKCIISAYNRKKSNIDIFEILFHDNSELVFSISKKEYISTLNGYMDDLIKLEEYELCGKIKKIQDRYKKS